ncbi:MAG TPA: GGDEF domain-containing protein [Gammaproteobacteria bacterium]|jgi:GGDEF domain-containing protein|nr:GGDEF domain-containing protein [Gammaproteobacteria bacterium]
MYDSYIDAGTAARAQAIRPLQAPITVFPNRRRFEAGVAGLLEREECAVLHVAIQGDPAGDGVVSLRMLNLVGNTLRACMRGGAVAYLGDAEFAVLLSDTDARQAATYARTVATIVASFHVMWGGEMHSAHARIGGVMAEGCADGAVLLADAMAASELARDKAGSKVHLMHGHGQAHPGPSHLAAAAENSLAG